MSTIIKRRADSFLYECCSSYHLKLRLETCPAINLPNIQIHEINVGQKDICFMRAQSIFMSPTPSKMSKLWEIIYSLTNNHAIYWKDQELASSFLIENAQH